MTTSEFYEGVLQYDAFLSFYLIFFTSFIEYNCIRVYSDYSYCETTVFSWIIHRQKIVQKLWISNNAVNIDSRSCIFK